MSKNISDIKEKIEGYKKDIERYQNLKESGIGHDDRVDEIIQEYKDEIKKLEEEIDKIKLSVDSETNFSKGVVQDD